MTTPPTPHPQLERALEKLTGKSYRVEIHDELGVVILRHPTEEPVVTAGKIEDDILEALEP